VDDPRGGGVRIRGPTVRPVAAPHGETRRAASRPAAGCRGFQTGDGPRPRLADLYSARELPTASYPERTFAQARDSDATLWFGAADTPGGCATIEACRKLSRSCLGIP